MTHTVIDHHIGHYGPIGQWRFLGYSLTFQPKLYTYYFTLYSYLMLQLGRGPQNRTIMCWWEIFQIWNLMNLIIGSWTFYQMTDTCIFAPRVWKHLYWVWVPKILRDHSPTGVLQQFEFKYDEELCDTSQCHIHLPRFAEDTQVPLPTFKSLITYKAASSTLKKCSWHNRHGFSHPLQGLHCHVTSRPNGPYFQK